MNTKEIKPRSESRNFFVSLVTLALLGISLASGENINVTPDEFTGALESGNVATILILVVVNLLNPIMKIVGKAQRGELNTDFLSSPNFLTQALTVVLTGVALVGIAFPPESASDVITAFQTKDFVTIWTALGINIFNPVYHFIKDKKNTPAKV